MKTENDIKQALAENIRAYLKREDVTQKDLAEMCGVCENSIGIYVRGKSVPSLYYAYLLSDVMGMTIDEMMMPIKKEQEK